MLVEKEVAQKEDKKMEVLIRGWFMSSFNENHRLPDGAVIFENHIQTVPFWKNVLTEIPVQIDGRCLKKFNHNFVKGDFVEIQGEFRTKNIFDDNGHKIQRRCYVFIKDVKLLDKEQKEPKNYVRILGIMARKGKIHHCKNASHPDPSGRVPGIQIPTASGMKNADVQPFHATSQSVQAEIIQATQVCRPY